jgi:hypothetical protein
MSFLSASSETDQDHQEPASGSWLGKRLCDAGHFLRGFQVRMRFGSLTRAPLHLLQFEVREKLAVCNWEARREDPWDATLPGEIRRRHESQQALTDAMDVRLLLFDRIPDVETAYLRIFRACAARQRELVIAGHVHRNDRVPPGLRSVAMRAKLLGFRFVIENGTLGRLDESELANQFD